MEVGKTARFFWTRSRLTRVQLFHLRFSFALGRNRRFWLVCSQQSKKVGHFCTFCVGINGARKLSVCVCRLMCVYKCGYVFIFIYLCIYICYIIILHIQRKTCKSAQLFSTSESTPIKTDGFARARMRIVDEKVEHAFNENVFKKSRAVLPTCMNYLLMKRRGFDWWGYYQSIKAGHLSWFGVGIPYFAIGPQKMVLLHTVEPLT